MAKGYKDPVLSKLEKIKEISSSKSEIKFINSRGTPMTIRSVPPYLIQTAVSSFPPPDPPTYTIQLEGGGEEIHVHDEESIAQSSPEDQEKWFDYQRELRDIDRKVSEAIINIILLEGVDIEIDDEKKFDTRMRLMGIPVPEDPTEKLLLFRKMYVIGSREDADLLITEVMKLTGITAQELSTAEESFPDQVES